jgi:uncharacterized membrane protein YbaN (DUF454 family)
MTTRRRPWMQAHQPHRTARKVAKAIAIVFLCAAIFVVWTSVDRAQWRAWAVMGEVQ